MMGSTSKTSQIYKHGALWVQLVPNCFESPNGPWDPKVHRNATKDTKRTQNGHPGPCDVYGEPYSGGLYGDPDAEIGGAFEL